MYQTYSVGFKSFEVNKVSIIMISYLLSHRVIFFSFNRLKRTKFFDSTCFFLRMAKPNCFQTCHFCRFYAFECNLWLLSTLSCIANDADYREKNQIAIYSNVWNLSLKRSPVMLWTRIGPARRCSTVYL